MALWDADLVAELKSVPQGRVFKIGEAARFCQLKPYILRFWETEFNFLRPQSIKKGQRCYSAGELRRVLVVRKLLHRDRYSIQGAKALLESVGLDSLLKKLDTFDEQSARDVVVPTGPLGLESSQVLSASLEQALKRLKALKRTTQAL